MLSRILKKALYIGLGALLLAACHSTTEEKKEPAKEKRFMYNDYNDVQIPTAEKFGISPIENRDTNFAAIPKLELVESDDLLMIEPLTHSVPYLTSNAKALLQEIARQFRDSLDARGARPYCLHTTSLLRTLKDIEKLQSVNSNASAKSAHTYGTTFDIAHNNFNPSPKLDKNPGTNLSDNELKHILAHVLFRLRMQKKCWVLIEERQKCFHITVNS